MDFHYLSFNFQVIDKKSTIVRLNDKLTLLENDINSCTKKFNIFFV